MDMQIEPTVVCRTFPDVCAAFVKELPGANTVRDAARSSREPEGSVDIVLQAYRDSGEESFLGADLVREAFPSRPSDEA